MSSSYAEKLASPMYLFKSTRKGELNNVKRGWCKVDVGKSDAYATRLSCSGGSGGHRENRHPLVDK